MKPRIIKPPVVWALLVVFFFSLFPVNFASEASGYQNSSKTQRRGKNGGTSTTKPDSTAAKSQSEDARPIDVEVSGAEKASTQAASPGTKPAAEDGQKEAGKEPSKTFEEARTTPSQGKREPLPFDRPPAGAATDNTTPSAKPSPGFDRPASTSSQSESNSSVSSPQPSQPKRPGVTVQKQEPQTSSPRASQPGQQPQRYPSTTSQPSWDRDDEQGSRTTPPVLRREPDSRNSTGSDSRDGSRGAPPVLTRPTDPRNTNPSPSNPSGRTSQQSPTNAPPVDNDEPIKLEGTLVNIPVLVSDRSNRYVSQLSARDFQLYEDGVQQEVAFFGNEEVPFSVALLLDMSPSVQDNHQAIQDAAVEFVRQLRPQDRVMVVSFARSVDYLTDFTSDRRQLEYAIRSTSVGGGTSVYEAVYRTVAERFRGVDGRKALILFSDGEDTTSRGISYDDAVNVVVESDVLVYGLRYAGTDSNIRVNPWPRNRIPDIGIPLPFPWPFPRRRRGPFTSGNLLPAPNSAAPAATAGQWPRRGRGDFMTDITNAGGGPVFNAESINDYRGLAFKIAEELRHVYVVSYYPSNPLSNGGYRAIRLRVKNRDDIAVRHRKGYNAKDMAKGS